MERDKHQPSPLLYILVCLFGINASLAISALWVEYPVLISAAPEGRSLVIYFVVLLEISNVASVAYLLARKCSSNRLSEVPFIYTTFALGIASFVLLAFFWDHSTEIVGRSHSFILLICTFFSSLIACVSSVTYVPFTASLREPYVTGGMFGEGLGRLIAHLVGIAQGIGRKPDCQEAQFTYWNASRNYYRNNYYPRTTTPIPIPEQQLRFDETCFFFIFSGLVGLSALCFMCLRCCRGCKTEYVEYPPIDTMLDDVELAAGGNMLRDEEEEIWQAEGAVVLDDGTIRHRNDHPLNENSPRNSNNRSNHQQHHQQHHQLHHHPHHNQYAPPSNSNTANIHNGPGPAGTTTTTPVTTATNTPTRTTTRQQQQQQQQRRVRLSTTTTTSRGSTAEKSEVEDPSRPRSFLLLMGIAFWTSSILNGPLSSLKAYACFPVGNTAFLIGCILSTLFTVITCPIALRVHDTSRVTIVVALTSLGTILLTYFVALITFSHTTDSKDSPLFGNAGELLATIAWIAITGLFSIAQVTVALLCRDASREAVTWFAVMVALGSAVGTLCVVDNISVCKVFRSYEKPVLCTEE